MSNDKLVLSVTPLGHPPWKTLDPFLFCVHHHDAYPAGNDHLGPALSLAGRDLGQDFSGKDGFSMYHGEVVPGFPQHPHRGFETVTVVRHGLIDHSDSLGATARFGGGDTQWLTAGAGIVHCEMFPLLKPDQPNPAELFQIWLNLPAADKMAAPHFTMLWNEEIPRRTVVDDAGHESEIAIVAGRYADAKAPSPPPKSWASRADGDVAIWTVKLTSGAKLTLPAAKAGSNRSLYFFEGTSMKIAGTPIPRSSNVVVKADAELELQAGADACEVLLLQGRPIGERVEQYGPFVMNTREQLQQAFQDYQRTQFGGWPWPSDAPVHARDEGRFARHADGRVERRPAKP